MSKTKKQPAFLFEYEQQKTSCTFDTMISYLDSYFESMNSCDIDAWIEFSESEFSSFPVDIKRVISWRESINSIKKDGHYMLVSTDGYYAFVLSLLLGNVKKMVVSLAHFFENNSLPCFLTNPYFDSVIFDDIISVCDNTILSLPPFDREDYRPDVRE